MTENGVGIPRAYSAFGGGKDGDRSWPSREKEDIICI